jgi:hemerythrin
MSLLIWNESLTVNVRELDEQHKGLVDMLNQLHTAVEANRGKTAVEPLMAGLMQYAATHFADEERFMLSFHFTGYAAHKLEHEEFTRRVLDLRERLECGRAIPPEHVMSFLIEWLVRHILGSDKKFAHAYERRNLMK